MIRFVQAGPRLAGVLFAIAILLATASTAFGQAASGTGTISGLVTDATASVVPDADVVVRNVDTNTARNLKSNEAGVYEAVALRPGNYEVKIAKPGFATLTRTGITLSIGQRAVVDAALTVSITAESVTVNANASAVESDKTDVSTTFNLKDMQNLPMNGRRWDAFAMATPGASNDGGFGLISFRGMSGLYNNNMIDGMDNNQAFFSEGKGRTRLSYAVSPEAVQEFQVGTSSFSAQYGRAAGGIVNAVTRSGTNDVHGSAYYLIRDDSLNGANPVGGPQLIALGFPAKPKDRRQQFGPSAGGAIKKDKLFYFLSYDQQKRTFPASVIPGSSTFLTATSNCTVPGCANAISFYQSMIGPQDRQGNQWLGMGKVDWNLTPRNQIAGTVNILRWDSPNGIQTAPTHAVHESQNGSDGVKAETFIARWNGIITPAFLSEVRFQYGRDFEFQAPNGPGPSVGVTNGINFGMPNFLPRAAYPNEKRLQSSQNLSWLHGKHSLKFGWDVTRVNDQLINLFSGGGVYSYSTLNDFASDCANPAFPLPLKNCQALNPPQSGIAGKHYTSFRQDFDALGAAGATEFHNWDGALYIEDSLRPVPTLTLNFGLRWEIQTMPPLKGNPDLPGTNRINIDKNNIGPRFGLAWDVSGRQRTLVRMGGGIYYGRIQNATLANLITNNGVRFKSYTLTPTSAGSPTFPNVLADVPTASGARSDVVFASPGFANPKIYQGEVTIEHELVKDLTLSAVYMLNRGQRLPVFIDTNLFPASQSATYTVCGVPRVGTATTCGSVARTFTVPLFTGTRPNTNYGYMTQVESVVNTWYHGLVIQAKKRFSHGFQFQAGFTYSKAQDDDQNSTTFTVANTPLNPFALKNDYSLSDYDQRKRLTMSGVWELPTHNIQSDGLRKVVDGFQLSGVVTLADGRPYSGSTSGNPTPAGITTGLLGVGGSLRVPDVGRNTFTSPGVNTVDLRLSREIKIRESVRWQLFVEAFNVANRVQITSVTTTQYNVATTVLFPNTAFQQVSGAGTNLFGARQIQLGTRVNF